MTDETHPANPTGHGDYERRDISVRGVVYFLVGLALSVVFVYLVAAGIYAYLDKRSASEQAPVNPLVTNAPVDTRHIANDYPQSTFPNPKLEVDERGQLNDIRLKEEQTLATYDYIDKSAGTVRIPIDRAMDLIAERGLPVRAQAGTSVATAKPAQEQEKGKEKEKETKKGKK